MVINAEKKLMTNNADGIHTGIRVLGEKMRQSAALNLDQLSQMKDHDEKLSPELHKQ